jgi:hypothetical protein
MSHHVKDVDFAQKQITVREGKEEKDRVTMLPQSRAEPLRRQMEKAKLLPEEDLASGHGAVYLPYALECKYPRASKEWGWQYLHLGFDELDITPPAVLAYRDTWLAVRSRCPADLVLVPHPD